MSFPGDGANLLLQTNVLLNHTEFVPNISGSNLHLQGLYRFTGSLRFRGWLTARYFCAG